MVIALSVALGFGALTAVYSIPEEKISSGITKSQQSFDKESHHEQLIPGVTASALENYVDAMMMTIAVYDSGESAAKKAVKNYMFYDKSYGYSDYKSTVDNYKYGEAGDFDVQEYGRCWHGYLVFLKPMLAVFSYMQVRAVNAVLQAALFAVLLWLMYRNGLKKYIIAFVLTMLSVCFFIFPMSLQFSWVFYTMLIACVGALLFKEKLKKRENRFIFFLIIGIATSYSDLLTFPLVTAGIPMILLALTDEKEEDYSSRIMLPSFGFWCTGYLSMWLGKWVVYAFVTGSSPVSDVVSSVVKRVGYAEESAESYQLGKFSFFDVLYNNMKELLFNPMVIPAVILIILLVSAMKKSGKYFSESKNAFPFTVISVLPFIWFFVFNNHSYVHSRYTFRILAITVFAVMCMAINITGTVKKRR